MKEKLNFPGGYLPEGGMWFSEYLRSLIGAILGPHPVETLPPHPSLSYYNTSACTPSEDDNAHALKVIVGTSHCCRGSAPVLFLSVFEGTRRTTSPLQVSTLRGNLISLMLAGIKDLRNLLVLTVGSWKLRLFLKS